ncbi:MAG TPA: DUF1059 domain-containing protein [Nitrosopumilaceae archaeon]|nr:DUF1059 domain-containing protein [Nitrosopumilaceae archaeon]
MIRLTCKDHGFNCNFEAEGENIEKVITVFGNHTALNHGVRYAKESLTQFIMGTMCSCPYCNSRFDSKILLSQHIDKIHHGMGLLEGDTRQF